MQNNIAASYNTAQMECASKVHFYFGVTLLSCIALFLMIADANAGAAVGSAICEVAKALKGNIIKGIATIAIIMLGIGAMFGKISWTMALLVAVGIAIAFGADDILKMFPGAQSCG